MRLNKKAKEFILLLITLLLILIAHQLAFDDDVIITTDNCVYDSFISDISKTNCNKLQGKDYEQH